jgi:hypothetical protein
MRLGTALLDATGGASAGSSATITLTNVPGASGSFNLPTNVPFTLILDPDTANEEVVEVTSVTTVNSTYVITRAVDSSLLSAHSIGAVVKHGVSARDYSDSRTHEAATTGVHGVTGSIAPLASPTFTGTVTLPSTTAIGSVSATEIAYLDGVSSGIQSQLDTLTTNVSTKAPTATPTFTTSATAPIFNATTKFQVNGTDVTGLTGAWTTYPCTWSTNTGTQPAIVNGSIVAAYIQIGKTVHFRIQVTFGSTTTFGANAFQLSLPVTPVSTYQQFSNPGILDRSSTRYQIMGRIVPGSTTMPLYYINSTTGTASINNVDLNSPVALTATAGHYFAITGTYEAA